MAEALARRASRAVSVVALTCLLPGCADATSQAGPVQVCGPVEQIAVQGGSHLIGDQEPPVAYNSTPPTSGWHASGPGSPTIAAEDDPLTEPEQVSVLEAGGVVVTYRGLGAEQVQSLERTVSMRFQDRVAVTPYDQLAEGAVAFTAWGRLQRCQDLDLGALSTFVETHPPSGLDTPDGH